MSISRRRRRTGSDIGRRAAQASIALLAAFTLVAVIAPSPYRPVSYLLWNAGYLLMVAIIGLRLLLVNDTTLDRTANRAAAAAGFVVVLCDPTVALLVSHVLPWGAPQLTDLWHAIFIYTCFVLVALVLHLDQPEEDGTRRRGFAFYAMPAVIVAVLLALSYPSASAGHEMYVEPDWRFATYFVLYALVPIALCVVALWVFARQYNGAQGLREWLGLGMILACGFIGALSVGSIAFGAVMMARGTASDILISATISRVHGRFMLPFVLVVLLSFLPSLKDAGKRWWIGHEIRLLRPMYEDCTKAIHDVVLTLEDSEFDAEEQLHRMKVEIADALLELTPRIEPLPDSVRMPKRGKYLSRYAVELVLTARAIAAGEEREVTDRMPSTGVDPSLIAEHWLKARKRADRIVATRQASEKEVRVEPRPRPDRTASRQPRP
ncbi:DUF6545 domain-containing protein [Rhodococcus sp. NPDC003318]|uniref:DUF6545 domain-containing protein n=1 Tax=Rhodococcus sp. NPDC003318 TaxID=3364503 RepID=UPI0036C6ABC1